MYSPWYSGMAQGQILSIFCRMYEQTGDSRYMKQAMLIFNSFLKLKANDESPWVTCIDRNKNLWFEEYPKEEVCFTLNGMIFAIYGIYDFYRITNNESAMKLLKGGLTTIKRNAAAFRSKDRLSFYCLKHKSRNPWYHLIHIEQMGTLYRITGDVYFADMAETLKNDTPEKYKKENMLNK